MSGLLAQICNDKRQEVAQRRTAKPLAQVEAAAREQSPPRGFAAALRTASADGYGLIAEIKKASPSEGLIRDDFDPAALARAYAAGGATCLSVLTDTPYFQGDDAFLAQARAAAPLPALRKDFMVDPYQVPEARAIGADCILLIMAALDDGQAGELAAAAAEWSLDVLVEVHDGGELDRALAIRQLNGTMLGINNRNLSTLKVDLATTEALAPRVPTDRLLVAESGLSSPADLARMAAVGAQCFLIGTSFMRQPDVTAAVQAMMAA